MQTVKIKSKVHAASLRWRTDGEIIAFVPTMGNLHEGHLKLVDVARQHASKVLVSIFVNPIQFAAGEDIDKYPRTLERDSAMLAERGVDLLFAPETDEMFAADLAQSTRVEVPCVSQILCGASRPGHFTGVTSIVAKLFNITQPDVAIFGEKDFQQLFLIRQMVKDLDYPIKIIGVATVRDADGLALSSRNSYLNQQQRLQAPLIYQCLQHVEKALHHGDKDFLQLEKEAAKMLENAGILVEYVSIRRVSDLMQAVEGDQQLVVLVAARVGEARLIDNIVIELSDTI